MENNKENSVVPALKTGSGFGSGQTPPGRNQIFGKKLKERRELFGFIQSELAKKIGSNKGTIQNYELGSLPKGNYAIALAKVLECSLDWLLMDKGPEPDPPGGEKQIDKTSTLYNKVEPEIIREAGPEMEYGAGMNLKDELIYSQKKIITHLEKENSDLKAQLKAIEKERSEKPIEESIEKKAI